MSKPFSLFMVLLTFSIEVYNLLKVQDLLAKLFMKDNLKRISANDLMNHPFITG